MTNRTFSSISVKNTPANLEHANTLGYPVEVKGGNVKIEIPANAYPFASNPAKLKKALGF